MARSILIFFVFYIDKISKEGFWNFVKDALLRLTLGPALHMAAAGGQMGRSLR